MVDPPPSNRALRAGGGGGWADIPLTPFLSDLGVVRVGAWVDMGLGESIVGVYGTMDGPPEPFPVRTPFFQKAE